MEDKRQWAPEAEDSNGDVLSHGSEINRLNLGAACSRRPGLHTLFSVCSGNVRAL